MGTHKSRVLHELSYTKNGNVAQFVSFDDKGVLEFYSINKNIWEDRSTDKYYLLCSLLEKATYGKVNIRTYKLDSDKSQPFIRNLSTIEEIYEHLDICKQKGLFTIVSELICTNDGGVSGVMDNSIIEFAPGVTPREMEELGIIDTAVLPKRLGCDILGSIYGITFEPFCSQTNKRIEFSTHPYQLGNNGDRKLIWQINDSTTNSKELDINWPNTFSRMIGDKVYGLMVAYFLGFNVPCSTVYNVRENVPVFVFGRYTKTGNTWTRSCPNEPQPGKYPTYNKFIKPSRFFNLCGNHPEVVSCIHQEEVNANYSGGAIIDRDLNVWIDGVEGFGDKFMMGNIKNKSTLPNNIYSLVKCTILELYRKINNPIKIEWAIDNNNECWILQLHADKDYKVCNIIVDDTDTIEGYLEYDPICDTGLCELHELITKANLENKGIRVTRKIGITSHVADILRKNNTPSFVDI